MFFTVFVSRIVSIDFGGFLITVYDWRPAIA
jgi:hypothetical protein